MNHAILKKLGFNPIDKVNTKEQKISRAINDAFEGENMQT